jgi:hypothetical protein
MVIDMIIESIIPFHSLTSQKQIDLVVKLQTIRSGMEIIAKRARVKKVADTSKIVKKKQLTFASKELEAIFNTYTPEMKKLILEI